MISEKGVTSSNRVKNAGWFISHHDFRIGCDILHQGEKYRVVHLPPWFWNGVWPLLSFAGSKSLLFPNPQQKQEEEEEVKRRPLLDMSATAAGKNEQDRELTCVSQKGFFRTVTARPAATAATAAARKETEGWIDSADRYKCAISDRRILVTCFQTRTAIGLVVMLAQSPDHLPLLSPGGAVKVRHLQPHIFHESHRPERRIF